MPAFWRKSFITPIFKNGNKRDILNYRPIAIMRSISKIFDAIMANKLVDNLLVLVVENQHGFVKNTSIVTNLINYSHNIAESLNEGKKVVALCLDFARLLTLLIMIS